MNAGCVLVAEYVDDGKDALAERLIALKGRRLPSSSGRKEYVLAEVEVGKSVTLTGSNRSDSVLKWGAIERVYTAASNGLTPTEVDNILREDPATHNASTMCALILALRNPGRIRD